MIRGDRKRPLPRCATEFVDRVVANMQYRGRVSVAVRKELLDHFEDAVCAHDSDEEREAEAQELIAEFGDEAVLAELIRRGKKRCNKGDPSRALGFCLVVLIVLMAIFRDGSPFIYINMPSLIISLGIPAALGLLAFGALPLALALWAIRALFLNTSPEDVSSDAPQILRGLIVYAYAAAAFSSMIGAIFLLWSLDDPSGAGAGMAVALLGPLYSVLLAEGVFRPAAKRTASMLELLDET